MTAKEHFAEWGFTSTDLLRAKEYGAICQRLEEALNEYGDTDAIGVALEVLGQFTEHVEAMRTRIFDSRLYVRRINEGLKGVLRECIDSLEYVDGLTYENGNPINGYGVRAARIQKAKLLLAQIEDLPVIPREEG